MLPKIGGAINAQLRKRLKENENDKILVSCLKIVSFFSLTNNSICLRLFERVRKASDDEAT